MAIIPNKTPMLNQDPNERIHNFNEVSQGYSYDEAKLEASRCLNCKNKPCSSKCPVNIDIPKFISLIKEDKIEEAYDVISESSCLPAICGRVCPQESQCESGCTLGARFESVSIGRLERFVADYHRTNYAKKPAVPPSNGIKIAVIGSGPSGLACAGDLRKAGFDVTIFEALHVAGGVLSYGIPEFRLPKDIVKNEIDNLLSLGVKIQTDTVIGRTLTIDDLKNQGFAAIYVGTGAGLPKFMGIEGENLNNVFSANEFLTRINLMKANNELFDTPIGKYKHVVVVGGGNVAMDAARCARRLGSEVTIVYRRTEKELPARKEEVEHAKEEGIVFNLLTNPLKIIPNDQGFVKEVECIKMELGEPDASGRRSPIEIKDSNFKIECDCIIMALGTSPNPLIKNTTKDLETSKHGGIVIDDNGETSIENIYAGGDAVSGAATVILAMGAGKKAAASIIKKFSK